MPLVGYSQDAELLIDGQRLPANLYDDLVDARVEQSLSVPARFTLRFRDPDFEILDSGRFKVGQTIDIKFADETGTMVAVIKGEVVAIGVEQLAGARHELTITGYDFVHRLSYGSVVRAFQNMSYSDIVGSIARERGLRAQVDATLTRPTFEYLVQNTSDYRFLQEIAHRTGCEWQLDGTTLKMGPRVGSGAPAVTLKFGDTLSSFKARYSAAEHDTEVSVRGWDRRTKQAIVGTNTDALRRPAGTNGVPLSTTMRPRSYSFPSKSQGPGVVDSAEEATSLAGARAGLLGGTELAAKGEAVGVPALKPGALVKIEGLGSTISGSYYVTAVEHVFGSGCPLTTRFTVGGTEPSTLVDLLAGAQPQGPGLMVGVVTNLDDPDNQGRVRVKLPALSDEVESAWARIVTLGAGANRGLMFMPAVDDEVLVGFEQGDLRRPFVFGGLWNGVDAPAAPTGQWLKSGKVAEWLVKSPHGHTLTFKGGDAPADNAVTVLLKDGKTKLHLAHDKVELWAAAGMPLQLKSGQASITLTANGDVQIKGTNVTVEATTGLTLKGLTIEGTANTSAKLEGKAALELKGGGTAKLEASGITEVKGAMVKIN
jgi:uncharacterized protein involved in type VI secretion and phage assembly